MQVPDRTFCRAYNPNLLIKPLGRAYDSPIGFGVIMDFLISGTKYPMSPQIGCLPSPQRMFTAELCCSIGRVVGHPKSKETNREATLVCGAPGVDSPC
jgi:hypothetical protein